VKAVKVPLGEVGRWGVSDAALYSSPNGDEYFPKEIIAGTVLLLGSTRREGRLMHTDNIHLKKYFISFDFSLIPRIWLHFPLGVQ